VNWWVNRGGAGRNRLTQDDYILMMLDCGVDEIHARTCSIGRTALIRPKRKPFSSGSITPLPP